MIFSLSFVSGCWTVNEVDLQRKCLNVGGEEESAVRREKGGSEASDRPLRSSYFSLPKSFPTKKKVD